MRLIERLAAGRKGWSEEPFWSLSAPPLWSGGSLNGEEQLPHHFESYVQKAYKDNGIVFAVVLARLMLFTEARFRWRRESDDGQPGQLFTSPALGLLDRPWRGVRTGALLARAEQDASLAGNHFACVVDDAGRVGAAAATGPGRRVRRLRPDWVTIISGSRREVDPDELADPDAIDAEPVGIWYRPPRGQDEVILTVGQYAHYAPIPDPIAHWRGMSWLTPALREIEADKAAMVHKGRFFRNGATPGMVASLDKSVRSAEFQRFVALFNSQHRGAEDAYKTLFLGGGADVKPLTMDMRQLDFKITQGAGETRIAADGGVPPIIVGLSEGLQAATYSNYGQARRRFADGTMRQLWRDVSAAYEMLVGPPPEEASHLWYDDRHISFLQEDQKDAAEIAQQRASTIRQLIDAGYKPDSVVRAVDADDFALLVGQHSGLYSVQLQPPGTQQDAKPPAGGQGEGA